ncbi:MAG: extracellular solute-binding protein [Candidatus Lokiarchaeota archaeon]|nr:extracellular solute-binding protein [Candidatus Lokiarchaeota archaeon]
MKKKILLVSIISLSLVCLFFNFGFAKWTSLEENSKPYSGVTLRLIGESLPPLEGLDQVKNIFEEKTGIKVIIEMYGHEEVIQKTTADFVGKTAIYDVVLNPHREIGKLAENGWITPLKNFYDNENLRNPELSLEGTFLSQQWFNECCAYQDTVYGLPFHFISMFMWYRYDLFEHPEEMANFKEKYGYGLPSPPITMEDYLNTAEFFTRKKGEKLAGETLEEDFYGTAIQAARHVATWYGWLNFLYSFGGRELLLDKGSDYGEVVINSPEAIASLEYYKKLLDYSPPGGLTYTWDETQASQQQGIVAQAIQWDDATYAVEDPNQSLVAGKMAFSGTPIKEEKMTQIEGWTMFIPVSSKKQEAAWLFVQWCMEEDSQIAQMLHGGASSVRKIYNNDKIKNIIYAPTAVYLKSNEVLKIRKHGDKTGLGVPETFVNAVNPSTGDTTVTIVPKPTFPEQEWVAEKLELAVNSVLTGEKTAKEALEWCQEEIEKELPE